MHVRPLIDRFSKTKAKLFKIKSWTGRSSQFIGDQSERRKEVAPESLLSRRRASCCIKPLFSQRGSLSYTFCQFIFNPLVHITRIINAHHAPPRARPIPVPLSVLHPPEELPGLQERRHGAAALLSREPAATGAGAEQRVPEPRAERRERRGHRGAGQRRWGEHPWGPESGLPGSHRVLLSVWDFNSILII